MNPYSQGRQAPPDSSPQQPSSRPPAAQQQGAQGGAAGGQADPADVVESNRSFLNPTDGITMMGRLQGSGVNQDTTLAEFLTEMGLDLQGPALPQLIRFTEAQLGNQTALGKVQNIAEGNNVQPGMGQRAADQLARADAGRQNQQAPPPAGMNGGMGAGMGTPPAGGAGGLDGLLQGAV